MCKKRAKSGYFCGALIGLALLTGLGTPLTAMAKEEVCYIIDTPNYGGADRIVSQQYYAGEDSSEKIRQVRDALVEGVEKMSSTIDISKYKITKEEFNVAWNDAWGNVGTFFVVKANASKRISDGTYVTAVNVGYDSQYTAADIQKYVAKRKAVLSTVLRPGMTNTEKFLALHDYLVSHNCYDLSYTGYSAYDALVKQASVCDGYAKCYSDLIRTLGLEATRVTSNKLNHAWDAVKLDGEWYHVDCTWDDPVRISDDRKFDKQTREHPANGITGRVQHNNFLLSDDGIKSTGHTEWDTAVNCTGKKYDSDAPWSSVTSAIVYTGMKHYTIKYGTDGFGLYQNDTMLYEISGSGTWPRSYSFLSYDDGYLFYNDNKSVYAVWPGNTDPQVVCTYTGDGEIYGCVVQNGEATLLVLNGGSPYSYSESDQSVTLATGFDTSVKPAATTYKIVYNLNGGTNSAENPESGSSDEAVELKDPVRVGYLFKGWYQEAGFVNQVISISEGTTSNVTLYAKWEKHTAHVYDDGEVTKEATCVSEGLLKKTCTMCAEVKEEVIPKNDNHAFDEGKVTKEATCVAEGVMTYTCSRCGGTKTEAIEKNDNHSFDEGKVTKEATCSDTGEKTYTCSLCSATKTEELEKDPENHPFDDGVETKRATCAQEGSRTYTCLGCGKTKVETIEKTEHVFRDVIAAATLDSDGSFKQVCNACGEVQGETAIRRPKTFKLSATKFTYNGKVKRPAVTVKDAAGEVIDASNYKVTYANSKNVGTYQATITFVGNNYSGTKRVSYEIDPAGTKLKSVKAGSRKLTVKWAKNTKQVTGYEIQYSTNANFTKSTTKTVSVKGSSSTSKTLKSLKGGKTYYVKIRTYKLINGKKYYSSWSKTVKTKTKK